MKRKNAFTLIELLAVVVVLAIIALITVPLIMKLLYQSRLSAAEDSCYGIVKASENYIMSEIIIGDELDNEIVFDCNEDNVCKHDNDVLQYKGKEVTGGTITIKDRTLVELDDIEIFDFKCNKEFDDDKVYCVPFNKKNKGALDDNPGVICGNGLVEEYDSLNECHIKSLQDWNEFGNLVNTQGKNFENKTVVLDYDLNFNNQTFNKIGNGTTNFKGNFYGNDKTLSNININCDASNKCGIFEINEGKIEYLKLNNISLSGDSEYAGSLVGSNNGTVIGITAENVDVEGSTYVGGVIGYSDTSVSNIIVSGEVKATTNAGGVIGMLKSYVSATNLLVKDITITNTASNGYVGGLTGGEYYAQPVGIVEKATITGYGNVSCNAYVYAYSSAGLCSNQVVVNGNINNGFTIGTGMLTTYDSYLDTYIDGDDGDYYYFDYDSNGEIVIKSTRDNPTTFSLKGAGTKSNPYQISSVSDFKNLVLRANETDIYYKITKDIDFNNVPIYPVAIFAGNLDGDGHTLSNILLYSSGSSSKIGIVMQNNGRIENLKLDNVKVSGDAGYAGALVGYNSGTVIGITAENVDVEGSTYVGGVIGYSDTSVSNIIVSGKVTSITNAGGVIGMLKSYVSATNLLVKDITITNTGNNGYVGGLTGGEYYAQPVGIVEKATITGRGYTSCNAYVYSYASAGLCSNQVVVNGNINNGFTIGTGMLTTYDSYLDTYIDGDDGDYYYFDYDSNGEIVIKRTIENPITFNLKGAGTESNPYQISSVSDFKNLVLRANETDIYYKITNDIDFNNVPIYPVATFAGNLDGDGHTLSNISLYSSGSSSKIGIVMQNNGRIENLKLNNIKISGDAGYAGSLVGYNNGTVIGITAENVDVEGSTYVGGVIGYSETSVSNIIVSGEVTATTNAGGVIGMLKSYVRATSLLVKDIAITNTASNGYVGGLTGGDYYAQPTGIVEKATITGRGYTACNLYGYSYASAGLCSNQVVINGNTYNNGYVVGENMLTTYDPYLDTYLDENVADGYYFDYDDEGKIIIKKA